MVGDRSIEYNHHESDFTLRMPSQWHLSTVRDRKYGTDCKVCRKEFKIGNICWRRERDSLNQWGNKVYDELCSYCFFRQLKSKRQIDYLVRYDYNQLIYVWENFMIRDKFLELGYDRYKLLMKQVSDKTNRVKEKELRINAEKKIKKIIDNVGDHTKYTNLFEIFREPRMKMREMF